MATFFRIMILTLVVLSWSTVTARADDIDAGNVYQKMADVDENELTYARVKPGQPLPTAALVIREQGKSTSNRNDDSAMEPLFAHVEVAKLSEGAYPELIALLDNYEAGTTQPESTSMVEDMEIEAFLDKAMSSQPMQVAFAYIKDDLGLDMSEDDFRKFVKKIWFEQYTNRFGGNVVEDCTGFEHVFVGEAKLSGKGISGYHCWVKFYQDEKDGLVDYLGHNYGLPSDRKPENPGAMTLEMNWTIDPDGPGPGNQTTFHKPKGGFFVGMSPECQLAMGTVAYCENREGAMNNNRRRVAIDGTTYDMVLYLSTESGNRKDHIRSFFPIVIGGSRPVVVPPIIPPRDKPVVISKALPNPAGSDETGEWIEISNQTDQSIDLTQWVLRDRQGGTRPLSGTIAAGETRRFEIPRDQFSLLLGNAGDQILLFLDDQLVDKVEYNRARSDETISFRQ